MTKIAYLDCACGISGDMTLGALVDAGVNIDALGAVIGSLGLPDCRLVAEEVKRQGFRATKVNVLYPPEHEHRHLRQILALLDAGRLTERQKETSRKIFTRLAEAEAKVHGLPIDKIHFHEVGAADAIADVVGAAVGFDLLGVERITASPVPTGWGSITMAHGQCAIPAPATAELLQNIPLAESDIQGELTTPTGAAILSVLAQEFGPIPPMIPQRIGCGAGSNDWPKRPNILRIILGDSLAAADYAPSDQICQLETNLDDASGELIGYSIERLWDAGALDVYTTAISMKKNRPGVLLSVLCRPSEADRLEKIIFQETSTLGVRRSSVDRHILARKSHAVDTVWGPIEGKIGWLRGDVPRFTPEFDACRRIALKHNLPLADVYKAAQKAFDPSKIVE
jgi:pyridinium-3,5-bisthiocarboxylic acid mononucleotide nickel chelatase